MEDCWNRAVRLAEIKDKNASLVTFLWMFEHINRELPFEKKQQAIVYCNGRNKAIENALAFADPLPEIQDNDLAALSRDITNEVHGDYYLAQIIKKGVASASIFMGLTITLLKVPMGNGI